MNKNVRLFLFLAIISAISGLLIGYVNSIVDPIIKANDIKAELRTLEVIFPGAEFETIDFTDEEGAVLAMYKAGDHGYVVKGTGVGYEASTPIIVLIGFDADGKIIAVSPLQMQETNGFGARVFENENLESLYVGKGLSDEPGMLSGATLTSTAMKKIVTAAQAAVEGVR